jgi:uncharacterized protein YndB with AHSA1/START domain
MAESKSSATADREIGSTRILNASRELVWEVWTDPRHIEKWWGPIGFTTTTKEFDLRPGGQWLHTIHGPDGTDYRNDITFTLIKKPERIEYDHGPSPIFHTTVTFDVETENSTKLTMVAVFPTKAERDRTAEKFGAVEGMHQTLGRLSEYIAEVSK